MSSKIEPVLIVGAGPTGLEMAMELSRRKIPFRIIDKASGATDKSKALVCHARTLEIFDRMGIIDDFLGAGTPLHVINMHADGKQVLRLTMDELDSRYPFMLGIPQSETERLLGENLTKYGATVERQTELIGLKQDAVSVTATIKNSCGEEVMTASYVIGCDGAHSKTRHLLGLPFDGSEYPDLFWLADVVVDSDFRWDEIHLYTTSSGLCAFFPFSKDRCRVIADFTPESGAAKSGSALQDPTLEQIQTLVSSR